MMKVEIILRKQTTFNKGFVGKFCIFWGLNKKQLKSILVKAMYIISPIKSRCFDESRRFYINVLVCILECEFCLQKYIYIYILHEASSSNVQG